MSARRLVLLFILVTSSLAASCRASPQEVLRSGAHTTVRLRTGEASPVAGVAWTSGSVARSGSRRLLVSWNVQPAPDDPRFEVEARIRATDGDGSPWLLLGAADGRHEALGERRTKADGVRVAVDELIAEADFDEAEVRILAPAACRVERVCLTFSPERPWAATTDDVGPAVAPLAVPSLSQVEADPELGSRICSPTSVAMVLAHEGAATPVLEVADRAYDAEHDIYGNWPRAVQTAFAYGVPGYLTRLGSFAEVERVVASGHPVVLSVRWDEGGLTGAPISASAGHLLVVVGFDGDRVIVNDPAARTAGEVRRSYARGELAHAWLDHSAVAYVFGE